MKPVVDGSPWPWSDDGSPIDFFRKSQRPFRANAWKRRREEVEKSAAAGGAPPKKFSKLQPRAKSNWGLASPPAPPISMLVVRPAKFEKQNGTALNVEIGGGAGRGGELR